MVVMVGEGGGYEQLQDLYLTAEGHQSLAFVEMNRLAEYQRIQTQLALDHARSNFQFALVLTVFIFFLVVLTAAGIAWYVVRRNRLNIQEINQYRNHLEELIARRTQDLLTVNRELTEYSHSMAHDLRTPLRAITSFSQILSEEAVDRLTPDDLGYLDRIVRAGKKMTRLIEDTQGFFRIAREEMKWEQVDISSLCQDICSQLHEEYPDRDVIVSVEPGLKTKGHPGLLRTLFRELLSNAWKFTQSKPQAVIEVGSVQDEGAGLVYVQDNGEGFDMRYKDKMFSPFNQLSTQNVESGMGIGLASVKRILDRHGGQIWVESKEGVGTIFRLRLVPEDGKALVV
jgi:signal transduction histidine kinase